MRRARQGSSPTGHVDADSVQLTEGAPVQRLTNRSALAGEGIAVRRLLVQASADFVTTASAVSSVL